MHVPDPFASTIRLFVKITDGQLKLRNGQPLPKLKPETNAELILSNSDILDPRERARLTKERSVAFMPAGTQLWARVNKDEVPQPLAAQRVEQKVWPGEPGLFVAFTLKAELLLLIRGGKNSILRECPCQIPALQTEAASVNEAYTKISIAFQPSRRSHSGNVFRYVFYECAGFLRPLNELRFAKESEPESPQEDLFP